MSFVLPGVEFLGYNRLAPCSLALPHDRFAAHTDWTGSPTKRIIVHHSVEPPQLILAECQSSIGTYKVIVGRTNDDILTLYFGENGWMDWQSGIDLRRPFRPHDIYIKLFFTSFICKPNPTRVLVIGLGGGIWPILMRHYFPSVVVDVVEIDETVIALANDFFGLAEQCTHDHFNVCSLFLTKFQFRTSLSFKIIADDGFFYVSKTIHRYDMIFIDAFVEETMPDHINTREFFTNLRRILNDDGCLITNSNLPTIVAFNRLIQTLSATFQSNILLSHSNTIENARVIISGYPSSLSSIASQVEAIRQAEQLETNAHLEFSLAHLISRAYRGFINDNIQNDFNHM